jgi:hypothetical protein
MQISVSMRIATSRIGSPMRVRTTDTPTCCAGAIVCARMRVCLGAQLFAPNCAIVFCRRGLRVARLAGVPVGGGVQRGHRRVEHRVGYLVVGGMCRFRPAARYRRRPGRARRGFDAAPPMRTRACARAETSLARASACVGMAARRRDSIRVRNRCT